MISLPKEPTAKRQLWEEFGAAAPEVVSMINTLREQFTGSTVKFIEFNGQQYGSPKDFDPDKTCPIDDQWMLDNLTAAQRDGYALNVAGLNTHQRAVLTKSKLKGKKK